VGNWYWFLVLRFNGNAMGMLFAFGFSDNVAQNLEPSNHGNLDYDIHLGFLSNELGVNGCSCGHYAPLHFPSGIFFSASAIQLVFIARSGNLTCTISDVGR
jgi:hypothetical protein